MIAMPGDQIVLASFGKRLLHLTELNRQLVNQSGDILSPSPNLSIRRLRFIRKSASRFSSSGIGEFRLLRLGCQLRW